MSDKGKYCAYRSRWSSAFKLGLIDRETPQFYWIWELASDGSGEGKGRTWRHDRGEIVAIYSTREMAVERVAAANAEWVAHEVVVREADASLGQARKRQRDAALSKL